MNAQTYSGGCACGALRYSATGRPVAQIHCQCRHCQMRSGTGHSSYLVFSGVGHRPITGAATEWRIAGDSGRIKIHHFCPLCGTPTHVTFDGDPGIIAFHAGSLDEPALFTPELVAYASRAQVWDRQDPALSVLEDGPAG